MNRQEELKGLNDGKLQLILHELEYSYVAGSRSAEYIKFFRNLGPAAYCSDPSAIMPLAIENKMKMIPKPTISMKTVSDKWLWHVRTIHTPVIINENLYRAICIVLILMKEAENETK